MTRALFALPTLFIVLAGTPGNAAIFGTNDLLTLSKSPAKLKPLGKSVAMMVSNLAILPRAGGRVDLDAKPVSETWGLCSDELYADRPSLFVGCTGFLVGDDLLVTAGHCVSNTGEVSGATPACTDFDWVFDVNDEASPAPMKGLPAGNVYKCKEIIRGIHDFDVVRWVGDEPEINYKEDWALIRLDRKTGRPPLKIAPQAPKTGDKVVSIGHPMAMELMTSRGDVIGPYKNNSFRFTNDGLGGNSGSPILNAANEVVGIFVRGFPEDTVDDPKDHQCSRLNRCQTVESGCKLPDPLYPHGNQGQTIPDTLRQLIETSRSR